MEDPSSFWDIELLVYLLCVGIASILLATKTFWYKGECNYCGKSCFVFQRLYTYTWGDSFFYVFRNFKKDRSADYCHSSCCASNESEWETKEFKDDIKHLDSLYIQEGKNRNSIFDT